MVTVIKHISMCMNYNRVKSLLQKKSYVGEKTYIRRYLIAKESLWRHKQA